MSCSRKTYLTVSPSVFPSISLLIFFFEQIHIIIPSVSPARDAWSVFFHFYAKEELS